MKVGVITNSLSRLGGGLFWSVRALSQGLSDQGCSVKVFATEDEETKADLPNWKDLEVISLKVRGPEMIGYLPELSSALDDWNPDLLHVNGMWKYEAIATLQWSVNTSRCYVVSPRGMLDDWALKHSAWKKRLAAMLYQRRFLRRACCLHALNYSELQSIRRLGLRNPAAVIPNAVDVPVPRLLQQPAPEWARDLPPGSRILLFLGRLHPKKGLINLLRGWAQAQRDEREAGEPWRLVIAGWDQGGHKALLERLASELGINDSVLFVGPQFGDQKAAILTISDAFVLPSLSEGLPMAVLEAWAYHLPVLLTPQCNLPEGFSAGAALCIEPQAESICTSLKTLFTMDVSALIDMGERGRHLVESRFTRTKVAAEMYSVYRWILGLDAKPDCVNLYSAR
ncbi:glycosyltransferase [Thiococcus pfennigii]|uniref:glycosyltransferase n=1 Tax=Thiococcus pfennigii TaxID=1057 RepID=UPI00237BC824|nr:glycosyltransferase [Thiococcus pfennigii]MBK1699831.1 hypothetical protein [Thiococcus pfennigii]